LQQGLRHSVEVERELHFYIVKDVKTQVLKVSSFFLKKKSVSVGWPQIGRKYSRWAALLTA
jgi:hypothetical protein